MKKFNVTGNCIPEEDYMVDISGKIAEIKKLIDSRCYFTINRGRQYGKTTTLGMLERALKDEYAVASISFQGVSDGNFSSEENFCESITRHISKALSFSSENKEYAEKWNDSSATNFDLLGEQITKMCEGKKVVLMIDEADNASDNRIFVKFLNMLREKYIARRNGKDHTFHSVILAGVYDIRATNVNVSSHTVRVANVNRSSHAAHANRSHAHTCIDKNLKLKLINEGQYTPSPNENKTYNSPWNIAVNFTVDMSFCPAEIATMLCEYKAEHGTGMDIAAISEEIYAYTSGYPFLVSRICQHIDEKFERKWNKDGIEEAVRMLLVEQNTLFDDLFKNIHNNEKLRELLYDLLFIGKDMPFSIDDETMNLGVMYGFLKNADGKVMVANKIFATRINNYFVLQEIKAADYSLHSAKAAVIQNGRLDMSVCLEKFRQHYAEITSGKDIKFLERHGTLLFLSYLKPLINGEGDYYIEPQMGDFRMDIAVQYKSEQFVLELKLWHGEKKHEEAYGQLCDYLEAKGADEGYLLTFDFRKEKNKESKAKWVEHRGKRIFDVIV
ncbi:MAG: AAA-like domain-containing protein [Oscillospiraceae bacterium]|nr:AAA-like domain-containing protein [Oscillospiraceae bacterium]